MMAPIMRLLLAVGLVFGGASAQSETPADNTRATLAEGFVLGFLTDSEGGANLKTCVEGLANEANDFKAAAGDFMDALKQKDIAKIADGLTELASLLDGARATVPHCESSAVDLKALIAALRQFHGLRDLGQKVVENILDNGEEIGRDIETSKKEFDGKQYLDAGQEMGQAFRKAVLGNHAMALAADAPPATPSNIREALAAGFVLGLVSENKDDVLTCGSDLLEEASDFKSAVQDFVEALKQKDLEKIAVGLEKLANLLRGKPGLKTSCQASEADVKAIITALKQFHGLRDLGSKVVGNIFDNGEEIGRDIQASKTQFDGKQYLTAGRDMGIALRKAVLGNPTALADIIV